MVYKHQENRDLRNKVQSKILKIQYFQKTNHVCHDKMFGLTLYKNLQPSQGLRDADADSRNSCMGQV